MNSLDEKSPFACASPQIKAPFTLAPRWKRLFALIYDTLILFSVFLILTLALVIILKKAIPPSSLWFQLLLLCISTSYFYFFWSKGGQTIGIKAWGLILIDNKGYFLDSRTIIYRLLYAFFSFGFFGIGFLWIFCNKQNKTFYDILSHTQIVLKK